MEMLLKKEGVWKAISESPPTTITTVKSTTTASANSSEVSSELSSAQPINNSAWQEKDEKAMALIGLAVMDNQLQHIRNAKTAKESWNSLKAFHEQKTLVNTTTLMRKLWDLKLTEEANPQSHIQEINIILQKLVDLGEPDLTEKWKTAILLSSLPESYHTLVTALEARDPDKLTFALVQSKVIDEFSRKISSSNNDDQVFKIQQQKPSESFCVYCKRKNHVIADCRKLQKRNKHLKNKKTKEPKVNTIHQENSSDDDSLFAIHENQFTQSILDSGATTHATNRKELFSFLDENFTSSIKVANKNKVQILGKGDCIIKFKNQNDEVTNVKLTDVLYSPDLDGTFISIKKLCKTGFEVHFYDDVGEIIKDGKQIAFAPLSNLYTINLERIYSVSNNGNCIHQWHRIFGHRNLNAVKTMVSNNNLKVIKCSCENLCGICQEGKMSRKPFAKFKPRQSKAILDLVHSDVCGPMPTQTPSGKRYLLTFIDDYSRFTFVYLLRNKNEVTEKLKQFVELMKTSKGIKPKVINTDRGGEYVNKETKKFLKSEGIQLKLTPGYTPQMNGIAERKNRTLIEMAKCLLLDAKLAKTFWGEAINTSNYIQNRLITKATNKIPYELWFEERTYFKNLKIFGTYCYVRIPKEKRRKLDNSAELMILLGYDSNNIYRCYDFKSNRIIFSRDVVFKKPNEFIEIPSTIQDESTTESSTSNEIRISERSNKAVPPIRYGQKVVNSKYMDWFKQYQSQNEKSNSIIAEDDENTCSSINSLIEIPTTYNEAINHPNKDKWIDAMNQEISSINKNETWEICNLPKDRKAIGCKWLFTMKNNEKGEPIRFKARLVAQGFSQKFGTDYNQTFAPVAKQSTFRLLLSIASKENYIAKHLDIKTAFLYGKLNETIFMKQPPGFELEGKENQVCQLQRSLYGLKQAPLCWNNEINNHLIKMNFERTISDPCLYYRKDENNDEMFVLIYVDDILIISNSNDKIEEFKIQISNIFEIHDLGEAKCYLGIQITK